MNSLIAPYKSRHPGVVEPPAISPKTVAAVNAWIVNPAIDLLFCCGGLVWILFAVHFAFAQHLTGGPLVASLALSAVIGTHVLGETHTVATLTRVYKSKETRTQFALYTNWAALALSALALAGMFIPGVTPILAKIYLIWVAQHFTAQSYGLALLYCYKSNYFLSAKEKNVLWLLMNSTAAFAILRQFTYKEWNPDGFLAQRIPFWGPLPEWIIQSCLAVVITSALLLVFFTMKKLLIEKRWMPLPAVLMIATGILIFMCGRQATGLLFLYVPAFYHGSQYLVLSASYYLKDRDDSAKMATLPMGERMLQSTGLKYFGFLLLGAIAIYIGAPRLLEEFGFTYSLSFATIFCAINLHHFVTDQAIWKLRDPEVRKKLLA